MDLYWEMENDYPLLATSPTVLYPSYYVVQTMMQTYTSGMQMITANSTTSTLESMAARDPSTGRIAKTLINTGTTSTQTVNVNGLPAGIVMTQIRSDSTENAVNEGTLTANISGTFTIAVPPQTVVTLSGTPVVLTLPAVSVISTDHVYWVSPNQITFTFNTDIGAAAFNLSSLFIASNSGQPPITPTSYGYNSSNDTVIWTLPTGVADGTYTATLTGTLLSQAVNMNFFILAGDANHDGVVDANDFAILAANYGQSGSVDWNNGDFNYDRTVNALDFNALANNFGINLFATSGDTAQSLPQSQSASGSQSQAVESTTPANLFSSDSIDRVDVLPTDASAV